LVPRGNRGNHHGLMANQIAITTKAAITILHTTGVTCFELPLRGESLAAWLNSFCIGAPFGVSRAR
jgi:hypothetical protein